MEEVPYPCGILSVGQRAAAVAFPTLIDVVRFAVGCRAPHSGGQRVEKPIQTLSAPPQLPVQQQQANDGE